MRHRVYGRKLGRNMAQRNALRKNLVADLICHEEIVTTEAKARMLRPVAEKMITLAKHGLVNKATDPGAEVHARRLAAARIASYRIGLDDDQAEQSVDVVKKLFDVVAPRYANRPGGYTRLVKLGRRLGDNAKMARLMLIEEA